MTVPAQEYPDRIALVEAERLGIKASDEEVRQRIFSAPAFQENGAFSPERATERLKPLPFEDLGFARVDHHRRLRRGAPEVVLGLGKTALLDHTAKIAATIARCSAIAAIQSAGES